MAMRFAWVFLILASYPVSLLWAANHGWPVRITMLAAFALLVVGSLGFMLLTYLHYQHESLTEDHRETKS